MAHQQPSLRRTYPTEQAHRDHTPLRPPQPWFPDPFTAISAPTYPPDFPRDHQGPLRSYRSTSSLATQIRQRDYYETRWINSFNRPPFISLRQQTPNEQQEQRRWPKHYEDHNVVGWMEPAYPPVKGADECEREVVWIRRGFWCEVIWCGCKFLEVSVLLSCGKLGFSVLCMAMASIFGRVLWQYCP